jgi:prolyl 4-hydroxylase
MINIHHNDMHMVSVIPDFMTEHECEHILQHSLQTMQPSMVVSNDGEGQFIKGRTGSNTWLPHNTNDVILNVAQRLSDTVRMPLENAEPFQVVHYEVGQEYDYHWDSFDKSDDQYNEKYVSHQGGQRIITALGYLRDVPKGGETGFNRLGVNVQPKQGTVVIWYNVEPDTTKRELLSQHAGLPVLEGEKYAFNLWFRESKFGENL